MKKINIIVFIILLSSSQFLFGQQDGNKSDEEAFLQQIESSDPSLPLQNSLDFSNNAQIQQMGSSNTSSIDQTLGTSVLGNIAELIQNGNVNNAVLTQTGNGNSHFITQTGNRNNFEALVIGNNNSSTIDQFGNDNMINQNLIGNDMAFILSQQGNGNQLIQIEKNTPVKQYQIFQQGSGMKLIIINGGILP